MAVTRSQFDEFANRYGIERQSIIPPSQEVRLSVLRQVLSDTSVPYPITSEKARTYYRHAAEGHPFEIGALTDESVDLGEYKNQQRYSELSAEDHLSWACLISDQQKTKHKFGCREYLHGEKTFEIGGTVIPDYYLLNARIFQQTGWQLATVNMFIPPELFFYCHSHKFFPVTTFMRPLGTDYLEEPDVGHDVAGHVATFTIPQVAQVMNNHGLANNIIHREKVEQIEKAESDADVQRIEDRATELLKYAGRLYWFTVEFGLVMEAGERKAFGAGILSSPGETGYSIESDQSNRILIDPRDDRDLLRLATTDYLISEFQKTYFVMKDFDSLSSLTPERIVRIIKLAEPLPHHTWRELVPGDQVINVGKSMTSTNEKYYRLLAGQEQDVCLNRTAARNLRIYHQGIQPINLLHSDFLHSLPEVPADCLAQFRKQPERWREMESS